MCWDVDVFFVECKANVIMSHNISQVIPIWWRLVNLDLGPATTVSEHIHLRCQQASPVTWENMGKYGESMGIL